jgi:hypothetical protein
MFAHVNGVLQSTTEDDKLDTIRSIQSVRQEVEHEIVRHGLTENEAFEVESTLIDFIGLADLANQVAGHKVVSRGRMSVSEIIATYRVEPISIAEPMLLIVVNRSYKRNMSSDELYNITRGMWPLSKRREKALYACPVFHGIVREVYRIRSWAPALARNPEQKRQARWQFQGEVAQDLQHYVGGSVEAYLKKGAQFPVVYINC